MTQGGERAAEVISFDGTRLAAELRGTGDGLPLLAIPGVGARAAALRTVLEPLLGRHAVAAWDLRGLHASAPPVSGRVGIRSQVEDAVAVLDACALERAALLSWSSGSRIAFELALAHPERVAGVIAVCGGSGHPPWRLRYLEVSSLLTVAASLGKPFARSLEAAVRAFVARPEFPGLLRQSGLVGPAADSGRLAELFRAMADCDLRTLLATYQAVAGASTAPERLRALDKPVLLVAGERDAFVPLRLVHETAEALRDVRLLVYGRATHYLPFEFPARLAEDCSAFLEELEHP